MNGEIKEHKNEEMYSEMKKWTKTQTKKWMKR